MSFDTTSSNGVTDKTREKVHPSFKEHPQVSECSAWNKAVCFAKMLLATLISDPNF